MLQILVIFSIQMQSMYIHHTPWYIRTELVGYLDFSEKCQIEKEETLHIEKGSREKQEREEGEKTRMDKDSEKNLSSETKLAEHMEHMDGIQNAIIKLYGSNGIQVEGRHSFANDQMIERRYANEKNAHVLRSRCLVLEKEVLKLKERAIHNFCCMEVEEEGITNRVMKKLQEVKKEKERLAIEVEREEEMITNSLQKKMKKLIQDKIDIENQLEQEQESITNRFQRQVQKANLEKRQLEDELSKMRRSSNISILEQPGSMSNPPSLENNGNSNDNDCHDNSDSGSSSPVNISTPLSPVERDKILSIMGNDPQTFLMKKLNDCLSKEGKDTLERKEIFMVEIYDRILKFQDKRK